MVIMDAPRPSIATAPRGKGWVMMPAMVPRKMERRCHAWRVTPVGGGMNHMPEVMATQMASFFRSAPHLIPGESNRIEVNGGTGSEMRYVLAK